MSSRRGCAGSLARLLHSPRYAGASDESKPARRLMLRSALAGGCAPHTCASSEEFRPAPFGTVLPEGRLARSRTRLKERWLPTMLSRTNWRTSASGPKAPANQAALPANKAFAMNCGKLPLTVSKNASMTGKNESSTGRFPIGRRCTQAVQMCGR